MDGHRPMTTSECYLAGFFDSNPARRGGGRWRADERRPRPVGREFLLLLISCAVTHPCAYEMWTNQKDLEPKSRQLYVKISQDGLWEEEKRKKKKKGDCNGCRRGLSGIKSLIGSNPQIKWQSARVFCFFFPRVGAVKRPRPAAAATEGRHVRGMSFNS